jgi:hypothetical protein
LWLHEIVEEQQNNVKFLILYCRKLILDFQVILKELKISVGPVKPPQNLLRKSYHGKKKEERIELQS